MSGSKAEDARTNAALLPLELWAQLEVFKGSGDWQEVLLRRTLAVSETALLLCDVWNDHWCRSAVRRLEAMLPRMDQLVRYLRERGVFIIHAPSETMEFYAGHPARERMARAPQVPTPEPLDLPDPTLPVDASDGGCDDDPPCPEGPPWPWIRQHPAIHVADEDGITDKGTEVYSYCREHGIRNVLLAGVHTNMCVLRRSFAIKNLVRWRFNVVLVRDLTDTMYNPAMPPHVSHDEGTALVVEHIERHWCPTTLSEALLVT